MAKAGARSRKQLAFRSFGLAATLQSGLYTKFVRTGGRTQPIDERAQTRKFASSIWAEVPAGLLLRNLVKCFRQDVSPRQPVRFQERHNRSGHCDTWAANTERSYVSTMWNCKMEAILDKCAHIMQHFKKRNIYIYHSTGTTSTFTVITIVFNN